MQNLLQDKLQIIAQDELLLTSIRAIFNKRIEKEKPQIAETNDNVLLGEKYRAYEQAKQILDKVFVDINSYKINKKSPKNFNKER